MLGPLDSTFSSERPGLRVGRSRGPRDSAMDRGGAASPSEKSLGLSETGRVRRFWLEAASFDSLSLTFGLEAFWLADL